MEKKLKAMLRLKREHKGTMCAFQKHNSKDYVLLAEDAVEFRQRMDTGRRLRTCNGVREIYQLVQHYGFDTAKLEEYSYCY